MKNNILITGSLGLIGSACVEHFAIKNHNIFGIDNDMRSFFFGKEGSTIKNKNLLKKKFKNYLHLSLDIRNKTKINTFFKDHKPSVIIHCAAQPSHDLAAKIPFEDFTVNANATLNLLEAARVFVPRSSFIYLSTNKVYGDNPNFLNLIEKKTRWDFKDKKYQDGIDESFSIDQTKHSLFGCSKLAADILVQEYGKYYEMNTVCLRGGCLTGSNHSGVELHGFLSYLIKCYVTGKRYDVYGYKAKQVRDNISSYDIANFIDLFIQSPRQGEVYNIGGGKQNSISILEVINYLESKYKKKMNWKYVDKNRIGDHICYYTNLNKIQNHYPNWKIENNIEDIIDSIYFSWKNNEK